ncbi:MAG: A/G-specific adenine glycosylase [Ruminococcus sp.]|nr:A/G-specific adenine glycosylase [Ruminococcus sp.]
MWKEQLEAYIPQTADEIRAKEEILAAAEQYGTDIFCRECKAGGHVTCSGMILDETMTQTLMVYHNIYQSFAWTGGHADGDTDFLGVAVREAKEETGITIAEPLCSEILSLDVLPVAAHEKHGTPVAAHVHYNISFGLIARKKDKLKVKPDENSAVEWIPVERIPEVCREVHMMPVYKKIIQRMGQVRTAQQEILRNMVQPLCQWYEKNARDLPWRRDKEPYHVWLSEIMLQQTRVEAVKGYYSRFLERFPTVQVLARADEEQVRKAWEGLGYYTRARNLQLAAKEICCTYDGSFPSEYEKIRALPGIGDYTAGAIGSICFGLPVPAVDGNVLRVVMRLQDSFAETDRPDVKRSVTQMLHAVYPRENAAMCGVLTQALMELGAVVCIPNGAPRCEACPLKHLCRSRKNGTSGRLPVRKQKAAKKEVSMTVFLMQCGERYAVCQRPMHGLLAGLWEFPNAEKEMDAQAALSQAKAWGCVPLSVCRTTEQVHIFTHIRWKMKGICITCGSTPSRFQWKTLEEIRRELTMPSAFQKFLDQGGSA